MGSSNYYSNGNGDPGRTGLQIIRYPSYPQFSLSWFDIRVFYVRISNFLVDDSTPDSLTLDHIPLSPDTVLEVNSVRCSLDSEGMSSVLRKDRVDKKSEEATFVTTDSIRLMGSVKFQVFDKEDLVISGVLEMSGANGFVWEAKNSVAKKWGMKCESVISAGAGFLRGKQITRAEPVSPTIEVYVAGCFSGTPLILTESLVICPNKNHRKGTLLHPIPEYDHLPEPQEDVAWRHDIQVAEYNKYRSDSEEEYDSLYWRRTRQCIEGEEDGELSWFNAGVRMGVGISLGVCLGIGIGVGLLVRTYHTTSRTLKKRLF